MLPAIQRLYRYNSQMMERILETAADLSSEQFTGAVVEGLPSIRDTLVHIADAQVCHVSWWSGAMSRDESFGRQLPVADYPDLAAVSAFWRAVDDETKAFVASLQDSSSLERVYKRTRADGRNVERTL